MIYVAAVFAVLFVLFSTINFAQDQQNIYRLQRMLIDNPRDAQTLLQLAMEYTIASDYLKAVETYFRLLRVDPNNFHAYNNLGILYRKSGQFSDSLQAYRQAQKINPDSYWVPYNKGLCYEAMGRMQQARESYGRALSLNPGFTQALDRLRALTGTGSIPDLPGLSESEIYIADSSTGMPIVVDTRATSDPQSSAQETLDEISEPEDVAVPITKVSEIIIEKTAPPTKVRTSRTGPAASIFNQAMEALEADDLQKAIELYTRCVIADRTFLAEPENNLIRRGLEYLIDRPNRIDDGLFFRGFLIAVSGDLQLAADDMASYLEQLKASGKEPDSIFAKEAISVIERHEQRLAHIEALAQARKEEQEIARIMAETSLSIENDEAQQRPRAKDAVVKRMNVDQIIEEADRLSRERRYSETISVIETALATNPDNIELLMRSANAYADLMIENNDTAAGRMALNRFERIYSIAPEDSREYQVAEMMIEELQRR